MYPNTSKARFERDTERSHVLLWYLDGREAAVADSAMLDLSSENSDPFTSGRLSRPHTVPIPIDPLLRSPNHLL